MKAAQRRKEIINVLLSADEAVPGAALSEKFGVSRQIIVQDITILRGQGHEILSTHTGYLLQQSPVKQRVFKLKHTREQTQEELELIIDMGGMVQDVFVWHKVYGKVEAKLNIFSKMQVKQFIEGVRTGKSTELMNITGGYHYHTVLADSEETLDKIEEELGKRNFLVPEI